MATTNNVFTSNGTTFAITGGAGGYYAVAFDGAPIHEGKIRGRANAEALAVRFTEARAARLASEEKASASAARMAILNPEPTAPVNHDAPIIAPLSGDNVNVIKGGAPSCAPFVSAVPDAPALPCAPASADAISAPVGASGSMVSADAPTPLPVGNARSSLAGGAPIPPDGQGISMIGSASRYLALRMDADERARRLLESGRILRAYTVSGYSQPAYLPCAFSLPLTIPAYLVEFAFRTGAMDDDRASALRSALAKGDNVGRDASADIRAFYDAQRPTMAREAFYSGAKHDIRAFVADIVDGEEASYADGAVREGGLAGGEKTGAEGAQKDRAKRLAGQVERGTFTHAEAADKRAEGRDNDNARREQAIIAMRDTLVETLERLAAPVVLSKRDAIRTGKDAKAARLAALRPDYVKACEALKARVMLALAHDDAKEAYEAAREAAGTNAKPIARDRMAAQAMAVLAGRQTDGTRAALYCDASEALESLACEQENWREKTRAAVVSMVDMGGRLLAVASR